jgi:hypothetical protein
MSNHTSLSAVWPDPFHAARAAFCCAIAASKPSLSTAIPRAQRVLGQVEGKPKVS